ncbi:hypothetical protein CDL15_Pgr024475 [Punica granatum]|uniref:Vinorine synthase-like n=1 Tax=Punica granatum TaxID=22663 RepID=A0A218XXD8_PUNGR|nr:hypothetical protein CDL15_Pgr024475 [Punica granatum]PKI78358.1 hypothetical protein CRG98_001301 [Punica granatum]
MKVPYLETRVGYRLSDVLENPDPMKLRNFVPFVLHVHDDVLLGVQFNVFKCGGVALGVCLSHKVADGSTFIMFKKVWATICRGDKNVVGPEFVSAKLFPPENRMMESYNPMTEITTADEFAMKRFVFGPRAIEALRTKYAAGSDPDKYHQPTRVEMLSAFIWSQFATSTQVYARPGGAHYFMVHAVNLRTKFETPLPNSFGNIISMAVTLLVPCIGDSCHDLLPKKREAITRIDRGYVERLRAGDNLQSSFLRQALEMYVKGEIIPLKFSSVCRFPIYEADFGWGEPAWAAMPAMPLKNMVVFMDTKSLDGGVEAYISLKKEDMALFERDEELQAYVSPPSTA